MPVLSYVHQLFSPEQCQTYIHTLQRKDRRPHCPRCQSPHISPWGTYHYRPGLKRSRCKACRRTFNDLTQTLLAQSQRWLAHWLLANFLLYLSCSARRIARELGVHVRTSYRWRWWLRNAGMSYEMDRQLAGTVEADELYHTAGKKGQAHMGEKKPLGRRPRGRRKKHELGRGHYDKDRPAIIAWGSRQETVVLQATRVSAWMTLSRKVPILGVIRRILLDSVHAVVLSQSPARFIHPPSAYNARTRECLVDRRAGPRVGRGATAAVSYSWAVRTQGR